MIGLSRADFLALTLEEFSVVYERWQEGRQVRDQTPWEVMRAQTAMTLQPFVKSKLNPRTMFPLPWDAKAKESRRRRPDPMDPAEKKRQQERLNHYLKHGEWPD